MARYIDVEKAIKALGEEPKLWNEYDDYALGMRNQWFSDKDAIEAMPTADVVEVVRCKDCKHRIIEPNDDWCECTGCDINPDGFCEEGERMEDNDD